MDSYERKILLMKIEDHFRVLEEEERFKKYGKNLSRDKQFEDICYRNGWIPTPRD